MALSGFTDDPGPGLTLPDVKYSETVLAVGTVLSETSSAHAAAHRRSRSSRPVGMNNSSHHQPRLRLCRIVLATCVIPLIRRLHRPGHRPRVVADRIHRTPFEKLPRCTPAFYLHEETLQAGPFGRHQPLGQAPGPPRSRHNLPPLAVTLRKFFLSLGRASLVSVRLTTSSRAFSPAS
jgi:hypothetical protein